MNRPTWGQYVSPMQVISIGGVVGDIRRGNDDGYDRYDTFSLGIKIQLWVNFGQKIFFKVLS